MCIRDREYIPGKQNTVADALSRVNLENGTFEIEREDVGRIYHVIIAREELVEVLNKIWEEQSRDQRLSTIRERLINNDAIIVQYYQNYNSLIFIKSTVVKNKWKLYIPKSTESLIINNYNQMYVHMGPIKVVKALEEHVYIKGLNKKVRELIKRCGICQKVKVNNERKEGALITITSERKLEKTFLDICGPFPHLSLIHI